MARKSKNKSSAANAATKSKKLKNIFQVPGHKHNKKPKEIQSKLKKLNAQVNNSKRERIDANFKDLHQAIVMKKPQQQPKQPLKTPKMQLDESKKVSNQLENFKL